MPDSFFTPEERAALDSIRNKGAAVAVFLSNELEGADPGDCEDVMRTGGWDFIEQMKDPDYKPEDDEEDDS